MKKNEKCTEFIGTPYFIAPEIIFNEGYEEKVDIWSCGVILYMVKYL